MTFSVQQVACLDADLNRANVRQRKQAGRQLSYIEGWWAEAEANRIFGHHAWDSETLDLRMVTEKPRKIGDAGVDGWAVSYIAKVRVTVVTPEGHETIRDGVGAGHGIDRDLGLAHESAAKEAATDAEKRALKTFGNPFGLALYDKTQAHVSDVPAAANRPRDAAPPETAGEFLPVQGRKSAAQAKRDGDHDRINKIIDNATGPLLDEFEENFDHLTAELPFSWLDPLRNRIVLRREELAGEVTVGESQDAMDESYRATVAA